MEPFLKWAGGKRWLISKSSNLLPKRGTFNVYHEPFLGGGAVFFHTEPQSAFLSDVNADLINSYIAIRDSWKQLLELLYEYEQKHSFEFYYEARESRMSSTVEEAARFIYLNRTCWNGLYRVNKNGKFNVPIGTKSKVILPSDDFEKMSELLQEKVIKSLDFEQTIDLANDGDFVFIDPPYTVKHNLNGFVKYNENIFSWDDQVRLRDCVMRARERGVRLLLLNADHASIKDLYEGVGETQILERPSVIAGKSSARGIFTELVVKCFP